jgi:hypothetical protein
MSDILFKLLDQGDPDNVYLFNRVKNRLFKDYAHNKKYIRKNELWLPLNEITKEFYGAHLDRDGFNNIYEGIDVTGKGFITKKQFNLVAKCLIMSLITYFEKKYPIPGREISLCLEDSELPVQMEIIDTLSEDEINKIRKKKKPNFGAKYNFNKGKKNKKKNSRKNKKKGKNIINKIIKKKINKYDGLLIDIESDVE